MAYSTSVSQLLQEGFISSWIFVSYKTRPSPIVALERMRLARSKALELRNPGHDLGAEEQNGSNCQASK
jgi:hypothetical protein